MPSTHSADVSARNFIQNKTVRPVLKSMTYSAVDGPGGILSALCSYGPHFPVLVRLEDGRIAYNDAEFGGDEYQIAKENAGWISNSRVKSSPTTRNHVNGAAYGLRAEGYEPTNETITIAGFDMVIYGKEV